MLSVDDELQGVIGAVEVSWVTVYLVNCCNGLSEYVMFHFTTGIKVGNINASDGAK